MINLYKVPFCGDGDFYIGDAREGGLTKAIIHSDVIFVWESYDCDCIASVAELCGVMFTPPFSENIALVVQKLWKDIYKGDYSFPKCWRCYDDGVLSRRRDCCNYGGKTDVSFKQYHGDEDRIEFHMRYNLCECPLDQSQLFDLVKLTPTIKEFDVTSNPIGMVKFNCNIVKVNTPKRVDRELYQVITIGDDNTKKKIKCNFPKNLADYDKWVKGQRIELYGMYNPYGEPPFDVMDCRIISDNLKKTTPQQDIRNNSKYQRWRDEVISNGECYICGRNNHLEAHHINSVADYPDLVYDVKNGVCLCKSCHNIYHEDYSNTGDARSFMDFVVKYCRR